MRNRNSNNDSVNSTKRFHLETKKVKKFNKTCVFRPPVLYFLEKSIGYLISAITIISLNYTGFLWKRKKKSFIFFGKKRGNKSFVTFLRMSALSALRRSVVSRVCGVRFMGGHSAFPAVADPTSQSGPVVLGRALTETGVAMRVAGGEEVSDGLG